MILTNFAKPTVSTKRSKYLRVAEGTGEKGYRVGFLKTSDKSTYLLQ
jgi:hypothetical protein